MHTDGYFNDNDEPLLNLDLLSSSIEVLINTGFAASLIVPQTTEQHLTLHFEGIEEFYTATGQMFLAPAYTVSVNWLGETLKAPIAVSAEVREALLGSQMLKGCRLTIDYHARTVTIAKRST